MGEGDQAGGNNRGVTLLGCLLRAPWRDDSRARNYAAADDLVGNVLACVAAADEWKAMLEKDSLTGEFVRSSEPSAQLQTEYAERKNVMTELGLVRK